ncbi:putative ribosome biogenesis protein slx9-like [Phalaenopsis equestris]|uniref:putative ribosome biogenesis protein slx9-like n=1 Tax=Phalaenopsis equestris TaxID=78828 RepID=UPI0009E34335|nr:putative ribosome biogenesis protein slx9-like [Phalaenopsis equestris]
MGLTGLRRSSREGDLSKSSKRKIEKKLKFISKITEAVSSLSAKKTISKKKRLRSRQKKLRAYDLSALSDFLPDEALQKSSKSPVFKLNCKNRQKLVEIESELLRSVHRHPAFQADPIAAIQQHLEQTQPPSSAEEKGDKKSKKDNKDKRKKRSNYAIAQNMEMTYSSS